MKTIKQKISRILIRLNISSIFFFVLSLISITLAWFAFSNIVTNNMEIGIKAWNIKISDETSTLDNSIRINLNEFYPGIKTYSKNITVQNEGDLPGIFSYHIKKLRILDKEYQITDEQELFDELSQELPFAFNFSLDSNYLEPQKAIHLNITISWPLDSGNDTLDSEWGNKTSEFIQKEQEKKASNQEYKIKSCIEIIVELNVKQASEIDIKTSNDNNYLPGAERLININNFSKCETENDTCKKFYVIDDNNTQKDVIATYIMDPKSATTTTTYINLPNVVTNDLQPPTTSQILKLISKDIYNSQIEIPNISNRILGKLDYMDRINTIINHVTATNGTFIFSKQKYPYLDSNTCYWLKESYNQDKAFAIKTKNSKESQVYDEYKTTSCKFVPVIQIKKEGE